MCYELAAGTLLHTSLECGPARSENCLNLVKDEPKNIYDCLISVVPNVSLDCTVFRQTWVRKNGTMYQNNNAYLMTGTDPSFFHFNEVLVIDGNMLLFFWFHHVMYFITITIIMLMSFLFLDLSH